MAQTKIRRIGNSLGVTLPAKTLEQLGVSEHDHLHIAHINGSLVLRPMGVKARETSLTSSNLLSQHHQIMRSLGDE